jgi:hypothetical protein
MRINTFSMLCGMGIEIMEIRDRVTVDRGHPVRLGGTSIQVTDKGPASGVRFQRIRSDGQVIDDWTLPTVGMYCYARDWRITPRLFPLPIWGVDLLWERDDTGQLTVTVREWGEKERT